MVIQSNSESVLLSANSLTKRFKQRTVLDHVDLTLERGHIYGLVGNNGAGKTTFMRIIMGLCFPTSGTISLFGQTGRRALEKQRKRIGALIEQPIAFSSMSARKNLVLQRMLLDDPKKADIDTLLEIFGLSESKVGKAAISTFSLGMRQRYGLASALLGDPEFLVLDEPGTGLDPEGMRDLRNYLLTRNQEKGTTMLISSHILSELVRVATDFIILDHGKIIRTLTAAQLEAEQVEGQSIDEYFLKLISPKENNA